ncbi:MAG TPA: hypothetical protein VKG25_22055 [Bryobacteraceae bacterium]|nr:hypothetical protein [Bryobacteraceae bacterium]
MKAFLAVVFAPALLHAADDSEVVLAKCRERILARAEHLPNYTCNETVDRFYYIRAKPGASDQPCSQIRAEKLNLAVTDRLRLEVKVSEGEEIGSWPGASQFDSRSIFDLIGGGAFGTGPLGTLLVDVFGNKGATIVFQEEQDKLLVYRFAVPLNSSHYMIQAWGNWRPVPFDGTAWIDPGTSDIRRIQFHTGELPLETQACFGTTEVEYDSVQTRPSDFLAPKHSTLRFLLRDGTQNETSTAYSQCREYQVESTLRFDDGPAAAAIPNADQPALSLPAGMEIPLVFDAPVDSRTAAAGDVIRTRTRKAVLNPQSGQVLIPTGATVEARITGMRQGIQSPGYVLIAISLERFQTGGVWSPIFATLAKKDQIENTRRMISLRGANVLLPSGQRPNTAILLFPASKNGQVVPRGFQINWVTTMPSAQ